MDTNKYKINIIALDFDDTICYGINEDNLKLSKYHFNMRAIDIIKKFQNRGGIVILWTCRSGECLTRAIEELKNIGLYPDYINRECDHIAAKFGGNTKEDGGKVYADLYIDDRNHIDRKVDWNLIEEWLDRREVS
jgi:hypothetical protein